MLPPELLEICFSTFPQFLELLGSFILAHLMDVKWYFIVVLIWIFSMLIQISSSTKFPVYIFCLQFFLGVCGVFFLFCFHQMVLNLFYMQIFCQLHACQTYFSNFSNLSFHFGDFIHAEVLIFNLVTSIIYFL